MNTLLEKLFGVTGKGIGSFKNQMGANDYVGSLKDGSVDLRTSKEHNDSENKVVAHSAFARIC